jgi:hypothetical protein
MDNLRFKASIISGVERCEHCEFLKRCPNCICEINRRFRFEVPLYNITVPPVFDESKLSDVPVLISVAKPTNYWLQDTPCVKCNRRNYKASEFNKCRFAICTACYK